MTWWRGRRRPLGSARIFRPCRAAGSDASCAASHGLVARPITLAFAAENSHGYEIMHRNAVPNLAALLTATLQEVDGGVNFSRPRLYNKAEVTQL